MTTLTISDLHESKELDTRALTTIRGGKAVFATPRGPASFLSAHGRGPAVILPGHLFHRSLSNVNNQINIAVNSDNVIQSNSNNVLQF